MAKVSTRTDLVHVIPGRPTIVMVDGWSVMLSVHDDFYIRKKKELRGEAVAAHPDKKDGSITKFRIAMCRYQKWLQTEYRWYRKLGLYPPGYKGQEDRRIRVRMKKNRVKLCGTSTQTGSAY